MSKKIKALFIILIVSILLMILTLSSSAATGLSDSTIYVGATTTASVDVLSGTTSVTWSCSPSGIVTFEQETTGSSVYSVQVKGALSGTATIRAVVRDSSGNSSTVTVGTIQVILADGIYRVRNNYTDQNNFNGGTYYLRSQLTHDSTIPVSAAQHSQNDFGDITNKIYNNWRIVHLGGGEYVFRSLANEDQVLNYTGTAVSIETISSTVPDSAKWIIQGYNIKPKNNTTKCLGLASSSPSSTIYESGVYYNYFNLQVSMIGDMAFEKWTFSDDVAISELGLTDNAKYYIMNANSKRYMSLASTTEATSIAICTLARSTENYYQWTVQKQNDSKYQLINNIGSATKVMTVFGTSLYTFNDTNSSNQMFGIYRNDEPGEYQGLYYIKYGQYYVAENSSNNVYLTTTPTTDALWSFMAVDKGNAFIYTFDYNSETQDPLHTSAHNDVFKLRTMSWGYVSDDFINKSAQHADERLENVDIFVFRGHGNGGLLGFRNETGASNGRIYANTGMGLTDYPGYYFIDNHPVNSFSSIRCAILLGCNTAGESYVGNYNLVDEVYKRGAHCVIGTIDSITLRFTNPFFTTFIGQIEGGKSIKEAYDKGAEESKKMNANAAFPGYYIGDTMQYLK